MNELLKLLHVAGVVVWVGGMFFAHYCLRPIAVLQLPPPQRLPLMSAVLGRFFVAVAAAIAAILGSGFALMAAAGFAHAPPAWHLMMGIGVAMAGIFCFIALGLHPRLRAEVAAGNWPAAGAAMDRIRHLVATNLALGAATIVVATLGPYLGR